MPEPNALFLIDTLTVGGSEQKCVKLCNALAARGQSVALAYLKDPSTLLAQVDERVNVICLERRGKFSPRALNNLRRLIAERQISIAFCFNLYPMLYASLLKLFFGYPKLRVILAINTTKLPRKRDQLWMVLYAPLIRRIETVIFGCDYTRKSWQKQFNLGDTPSQVIYNGVDTKFFDPANARENLREELGLDNSFVIGCVARLDPVKNQVALLDALARLHGTGKRFDLILVGTGPEKERLECRARTLGLARQVHFLGLKKDVRAALATMDVFVLPSIETFSNAALEAMAMSVPVVLNEIGGAKEMISDAEHGFVCRPGRAAELADKISSLESDRDLRERIGEKARENVVTQFSLDIMIHRYAATLFGK